MTIAISGSARAGATAAAPAVQAQPQAAAPTIPTAAAEDKVTISAAAQEVPKPMSIQVRVLHNQGRSLSQIATTLKISATAVQSYWGTPATAPKG
jgi:DNA-directed RNA polymerase specialized sigma24 family protein